MRGSNGFARLIQGTSSSKCGSCRQRIVEPNRSLYASFSSSSSFSSYSSSSSSFSSEQARTRSSPKAPQARAHANKVQRKHDEDLRQCIKLYHLASNFVPSQPLQKHAAKASVKADRKNSSKSSSIDEELDKRIKEELVLQTNLLGSSVLGSSINSRPPVFKSGIELTQQAANSSSGALGATSEDFDMDAGVASDFSAAEPSFSFASSKASQSSEADVEAAAFSDSNTFDGLAQARLRREKFRFRSDGKRSLLGKSKMLMSDGLDEREARVRDALFGTVGLELPGLEIVRERVEERRLREQREKQGNTRE